MNFNENAGCSLGCLLGLLTGVFRLIFQGIVWIVSLCLAWFIIKPEGLGTGILFFFLWAIIGILLDFGLPLGAVLITQVLKQRIRVVDTNTLIYCQPNWHSDFQEILSVEVPASTHDLMTKHSSGRLPHMVHTNFLRHRYRRLADHAIAQGKRPSQLVADFLDVTPPGDDPEDVVDSIVNSEAFQYVMSHRDEVMRAPMPPDQQRLQLVYEGTTLEQIVRLLHEVYLNSLNEMENTTKLEPFQTPMAETHLSWMIEAMPQETERLYREHKLKDHLNRVVLKAEDVLDKLTAQGLREDEALEIVTSTILSSEIPYDEDEHGNGKIREQMDANLRDEILNRILCSQK